jgi:two-component sensor histidine kinase
VLTVVQAIVSQTFRGNPEDAEKKIAGRIRALAQTDELLSQSDHREVGLKSILMAELRPYGEKRVAAQGQSIQIVADHATPLALIFHELATNAAKYGALSTPVGRLFVSWKITSGRVQVTWSENSDIPVAAPEDDGFGTKLIKRLVESIEGAVETEFASHGLVCTFSFPLPESEPRPLILPQRSQLPVPRSL